MHVNQYDQENPINYSLKHVPCMEMSFGLRLNDDFPLSTSFFKPSFMARTTLPTSATVSNTARKKDFMLPFLKRQDVQYVHIAID